MKKIRVVFVAPTDSSLCIIAEGLLKKLHGNGVEVASFGGKETNDSLIRIMEEVGVDLNNSNPKEDNVVRELFGKEDIDYVISLNGDDLVSQFSYGNVFNVVRQTFEDPLHLGTDGLENYRRVRSEIEAFLRDLQLPVDHSEDTKSDGISFFEKYLTVWVLLCMIIGALIGYFQPGCVAALKQAEVYKISIPIAVLLWVMIFPMLLHIDFNAVYAAITNPGPILLTTMVNFGIQPFTMYVVALIFFRYIYATVIPSDLAEEYLAGCILLGGAPCTAMVFVWSVLVGGDPGYTIVQVAVNDGVMLLLYLPTMLLLLQVSSIPLPYETIAISVGFFIAIPLLFAILVRKMLLQYGGEKLLEKAIQTLKPVCPIGLLSTLIIIFIYQGETIGQKPLHILLIMIPLSIQTFVIFALTFWLGYLVCMDFTILAPASLISTSNFFELAVAIAISIFGPDSGASLATVVGVLVEVPTMLLLVSICKRLRPSVENRCASCDEKCPKLRNFASCNKKEILPQVNNNNSPHRHEYGHLDSNLELVNRNYEKIDSI